MTPGGDSLGRGRAVGRKGLGRAGDARPGRGHSRAGTEGLLRPRTAPPGEGAPARGLPPHSRFLARVGCAFLYESEKNIVSFFFLFNEYFHICSG